MGELLDGRNRLAVSRAATVKPIWETVDAELYADMVSTNVRHRNAVLGRALGHPQLSG